jgi:hypothetical protein
MIFTRRAVAIIALGLMLAPAWSGLAGSKDELPNDVTIELLGRCLIYSFSYQRTITPHFGVEGGMSILGGSESSILFFSGGVRLYATNRDASPCLTGGFVAVTASTHSGPFSADGSGAYFYIGPGFEYRSSGGFLIRGTLYFLIRDGFFVWPGAQIGVAF